MGHPEHPALRRNDASTVSSIDNDGDNSPHSNAPILSLIVFGRPITTVASPRFHR